MQTATLKVAGMSCRSCVRSIEGALEQSGVNAQVNFEQGTVDVQFDETKLQLANIIQLIHDKGYVVAE
ncbi:cation transporter [Paenibacillus sp. MBLB2552]|uniref:Cation transporter n=1 Tax=Paenibacillus mellifer TaxID=2937794 RepID=A0A9X1XXB7_9BACL|nr:heavy metal-associated domain-containing protein [Paenibacillus mellifer]MCK8487049.1 cation transporter [Paenibacillus mellifer]